MSGAATISSVQDRARSLARDDGATGPRAGWPDRHNSVLVRVRMGGRHAPRLPFMVSGPCWRARSAGRVRRDGTPFSRTRERRRRNGHGRIETLAKLIDRHARETAVPMVALKGAALHEMGIYRAGDRPMADLDLLVQESDMDGATKLLEALGFRTELRYWKNRTFKAEGEASGRRGAGGTLRLPDQGRAALAHPRAPPAGADGYLADRLSRQPPTPDSTPYPSRVSLLMHLVLHAAGAMTNRDLRLVHVHDLALLCGEMQAEDWEEILRQGNSGTGGPWWFLPPLQLARRYYPDIVPSSILRRLQSACPARLSRVTARQSITDFSLSSLWVRAFPGIAWVQSGSEAYKYMLRRVRPDAEARRIRDVDAANAAWAVHSSWRGLSQGYRIWRWLTSRPTRPATMYVVRETLAQPL